MTYFILVKKVFYDVQKHDRVLKRIFNGTHEDGVDGLESGMTFYFYFSSFIACNSPYLLSDTSASKLVVTCSQLCVAMCWVTTCFNSFLIQTYFIYNCNLTKPRFDFCSLKISCFNVQCLF